MVECGNLPDNPNSFANRVRIARRNQLDGARDDLASSRERQYTAYFKIGAAETLEEKKVWGDSYRLAVLGVMDASIAIADQKVRERKRLEDVPQELASRTNSIKLALDIQLGRNVDQGPIKSVIEELGLQADRGLLIDRIRNVIKIDSEDVDREIVKKAVKVTDHSVSFTKKVQKKLGVKEDPGEYE